MIQENNGLSAADVAAVTRNNGYGTGFGSDCIWWIIVLFLFAFAGNAGWGGFGGGAGAVPYMMNNNTNNDVQRGFDQQAVMGGLNGITGMVADGFSNANVARCNAVTSILQALTNVQTVATQGMNSLAMALQQCCCDNRQAVADLKYTIATENCADRAAVNDGVRDIQAQNNANTNLLVTTMNNGFQGLHDKLCQLELDGYKREYEGQIRNLEQRLAQTQSELAASRSAASQTAQTAEILANNNAQTALLENYYRNMNGGCGNCNCNNFNPCCA